MALEGWPFGLPAPRRPLPPHGRAPDRDLILLGGFAMHLTVFLSLVGQGHPPRDALVVTAALAMSGAAAARRLLEGDDDHRGGPRWGR
jgi:hypothetical protein